MSEAARAPRFGSGLLEGKRALVCGSTQGIGKAIAEALAEAGAELVLMARDEHKLSEICGSLPGGAKKHSYIQADFSVRDQASERLAHWDFANRPVHILINNTGGPAPGPAHLAEPEEFRRAFEMHLLTAQGLLHRLLPAMRESGYGRVVNVISTSVKQPLPGLGVSNTVRAAMANWSKTLATELAPDGITVNNLLPGATATERLRGIIANRAEKSGKSEAEIEAEMRAEIPMKRFAEPREIASAALFLCLPEAGYISGINLPVDGGRTACL